MGCPQCTFCSDDWDKKPLQPQTSIVSKSLKVNASGLELDEKQNVHDAVEVHEEYKLSGNSRERHPKHIFSITYTSKPLGIVVSSSIDCTSAYVTTVDGSRNQAIQDNNLPLNSKLLKCNGVDVEADDIDDIEKTLIAGQENMPLTLTFCHPDGLFDDEYPDPNAKE